MTDCSELHKKNSKNLDEKTAAPKTKNAPGRAQKGISHQHSDGRYYNGKQAKTEHTRYGNSEEKATAPYNFVSLPEEVLFSPVSPKGKKLNDDELRQSYRDYLVHEGVCSGYIELKIKTMTPCYIRLAENEVPFVAPQGEGKEILPGSSIRGMVKNIFKIVTAGAMRAGKTDGDVNNSHLYFRTMAGKVKSVREMYNKYLVKQVRGSDGKPRSITKAEAGFLICCREEYYICKCLTPDGESYERKYDPVKVQKFSVKNHPDTGPNGNNGECIDWSNPSAVACFSGEMNSKKHYTVHGNPQWDQRVRVPAEVIQDYKSDASRGGVDLFNEQVAKFGKAAAEFTNDDSISMVVPCFYVEAAGKVQHFGFAQFYRIPYDKSVGDHIPAAIQAEDKVDFTDALFGKKELWGSRLLFEDADIIRQGSRLPEDMSHPLTSPKPTSFQLYLTQTGKEPIKAWCDNADIRGYKLYWHNNINENEWRKSPKEKEPKKPKPIQPISAGWEFKSRIRFTNISKVELGGLLKVFELAEKDEDCCFKIGQGKALGMGSIRIDSELFLEGTDTYSELFTNGSFAGKTNKELFAPYVELFDKYLKENLSEKAWGRYQISQRELTGILDWKNTKKPDWKDKIAVMNKNDHDKPFQNRWILPVVNEIVKE